MKTHLEHKYIAVTGSTAGIGYAIAKILVEEGARVIVNGRHAETVQEAVCKLRDHGKASAAWVEGVVADIATDAGFTAFTTAVDRLTQQQPLYGLVNNMSQYERRSFFDVSPEDFNRLYHVNCVTTARLSQYYLQRMLDVNEGTILVVASEVGYRSKQHMVHYAMTKSAQLSLVRGMAEYTKGTRVRVNAIAPGPTRTEGLVEFFKKYAQERNVSEAEAEALYMAEVEPTSLLGRPTTAEEVGNFAVFLCSPLASGINGRNYLADGGIVQHI